MALTLWQHYKHCH